MKLNFITCYAITLNLTEYYVINIDFFWLLCHYITNHNIKCNYITFYYIEFIILHITILYYTMRTKHTAEAVGSQSGIRRLNTTAKKLNLKEWDVLLSVYLLKNIEVMSQRVREQQYISSPVQSQYWYKNDIFRKWLRVKKCIDTYKKYSQI